MTDRRGSEPPRKRGTQPGRGNPARKAPSRPSATTDSTRTTPQRPESTRERLLRQAREEQEGGAPRRPAAGGEGRATSGRKRPAPDGAGRAAAPRKRAGGKQAPKAAAGRPAPRRAPDGAGRAPTKKAAAKKSPPRKRPQSRRPPQRRKARKPPRMLKLGRSGLRLRMTFGVMAFVLSLFAGRLVLLQGVDPDSYAAAATKENTQGNILHASRGSIEDRNGVELAVSEDAVAITADPTQTKPVADQLAAILAPKLTSTTSAKLIAAMTGKGRFAVLAHQVTPRPGTRSRPRSRPATRTSPSRTRARPRSSRLRSWPASTPRTTRSAATPTAASPRPWSASSALTARACQGSSTA